MVKHFTFFGQCFIRSVKILEKFHSPAGGAECVNRDTRSHTFSYDRNLWKWLENRLNHDTSHTQPDGVFFSLSPISAETGLQYFDALISSKYYINLQVFFIHFGFTAMQKRWLPHSLSCLQSWKWSIDCPAGGNRCQYAQLKAPLNRLMIWSGGQWFWGVELCPWKCTLSQGISLWTDKTVKREPQEHHMKNIASTRQWEKGYKGRNLFIDSLQRWGSSLCSGGAQKKK